MRRAPGADDPAFEEAWDADAGRPWLAIGDAASRALAGGRRPPAGTPITGPTPGGAILHVADVHSALTTLGETSVDGCVVSTGLLDTRPRAALRSLRERLEAAPLWIVDRRGEDGALAHAAAEELGVRVWGLDALDEPPEQGATEALVRPETEAPAERTALPRADADLPPPDAVDPGRFAEGCLKRIGRLGALVRYTLRTLTEASNASRVSVMLRESETLRLRAARGVSEALIGTVRCSLGAGIAGRVAALGRAVSGHGSAGGARGYRDTAFVVLPLGQAGRCEGVVCLTGLPANELPPPDALRTWTRICRRAGLALGTARSLHRARALSTSDALTRLPNRRAFERALRREVERARRTGNGLVVALLDVDHFKALNDRYGHPAGDRVLAEVGARLKAAFRETDVVARWGGEEFAVLLPGLAGGGIGEAPGALERARRTIGGRPFALGPGAEALRVTISGGMAPFPEAGAEGAALVRAADEALYRAKEAGRDRIESA